MSDKQPPRFSSEWMVDAARQGKERVNAQASERLGGLTPEQLAKIEQIAAKLPAGQLQQLLSSSFAKLDPATLAQVADKLSANGAIPPAGKRTDPATLALLAATAMRGRAGGIAGLLMILAGSSMANRQANPSQPGQPDSPLRSTGKGLLRAAGDLANKVADAGSRSSSPRVRQGVAQVQNLALLARSPLARQVMDQVGPALLRAKAQPK